MFRLAVEVAHLRHGKLHARGKFIAPHAGAQHRVGTAAIGVAGVEFLQKIPGGGVRAFRLFDRWKQVAHRRLSAPQLDALML